MIDEINLVIGYIPTNWKAERISLGDAKQSGTKEVHLIITNNQIQLGKESVPLSKGLFIPGSVFWKRVSSFVAKKICPKREGPSATRLGRAYNIFTEEDNDMTGLKLVCGPVDQWEFRNDKYQYNGHFYFGYNYYSCEEYFEERVVVFK
jgi:hypothetical protein